MTYYDDETRRNAGRQPRGAFFCAVSPLLTLMVLGGNKPHTAVGRGGGSTGGRALRRKPAG